ncbi:MAG: M56 family metallopeptidase, partial [Pirellulaceae bacterium]
MNGNLFRQLLSHSWDLFLVALVASTLICLFAMLLSRLARRRSAAHRFFVWQTALLGLLLLPAGILALPNVPLGLWPVSESTAESQPDVPVTSATSVPRADTTRLLQPDNSADSPSTHRQPMPIERPAQPPIATPTPASHHQTVSDQTRPAVSQVFPTHLPWTSLLVIVWLCGCLAMVTRMVVGWCRVTRLSRHATEFKKRIIHNSGIPVLVSDRLNVPVTIGMLKQRILLPADAYDWSHTQLRMILKHELAHIARRDLIWQTVNNLVRSLYWFQPLVWLGERSQRLERERACDDRVLVNGETADAYARLLLDMAARLSDKSVRFSAAIPMATKPVERRLINILAAATPRNQAGRTFQVGLMLLFISVFLATSILRPFSPRSDAAARVNPEPPPAMPFVQARQDEAPTSDNESTGQNLLRLPDQMTGQILDHNGDPVPDAMVSLQIRRYMNDGNSTDVESTIKIPELSTNLQGEFRIDTAGIEMEATAISISGHIHAHGHPEKDLYYHVGVDNQDQTAIPPVQLMAGRRITGRLVPPVGHEGAQLVKPTVQAGATAIEPRENWYGVQYTHCADDGSFEIWVPADLEVVEVIARCGNYAGVRVPVLPGVDHLGDIEMAHGAVVSGQVLDLQGNPVSETLVLLTPLEYQDSSELFVQAFVLPIRVSVMTDMDGHFELPPASGKCSVL